MYCNDICTVKAKEIKIIETFEILCYKLDWKSIFLLSILTGDKIKKLMERLDLNE